jgi:anti-sigma B factor antagonist
MLSVTAILNVRRAAPEISVIDIEGEINSRAEDRLLDAFNLATPPGVCGILLNFEKMQFMNSSGIGVLISLLISANQKGYKLAAVGLSSHYQRIFDLTRLNQAIPPYPDERDALLALLAQV